MPVGRCSSKLSGHELQAKSKKSQALSEGQSTNDLQVALTRGGRIVGQMLDVGSEDLSGVEIQVDRDASEKQSS